MSKYKELVVYSGNLIKCTNGQTKLYRENVYLIYNSTTDTFYSLNDTLNYFLDLDLNNNLTEEQKEECRNNIRKHSYSYFSNGIQDEIYVDESSIQVVLDNNKMNK